MMGTEAEAGRCIVVFGTRARIGKTLVAVNLAVNLARRVTPRPVCLLDLGETGKHDAAKALGLALTRSVAEEASALKRAPAALPLSLKGLAVPHSSGVEVIAGVSHPRQLAQLDQEVLCRVFQAAKQSYAYTIIDGGKPFSESMLSACDAAHLVLLVTSPTLAGLYQTKWALGMFESLGFPKSLVKAVINQAAGDRLAALQALPCDVLGAIPLDEGLTARAIAPLTAAGSPPAAEALVRLSEALASKPALYCATSGRGRDGLGRRERLERKSSMATADAEPSRAEVEAAALLEDEVVQLKRRIHQLLVNELDVRRQELSAAPAPHPQMALMRQKTLRFVETLVGREANGLALSPEVRERLVAEITDEALGLGPLEEFLADPQVSDVLVNGADQIYVEREGRLELTARRFMSDEQVLAVIERIVASLGRRIDESSPMVDARLPDGSRINAIIPPLSLKGPVLSIRKFSRLRYTQEDLTRIGSVSPAMMQFLRACVLARKNILISGGTGSGKTTLLNALSAFIPAGERVITIEDAAELQLAQAHWVSLEARPPNIEGKGQVTMRELFRNALRMRPDRIIIGECRGAETMDMLQAMNTGHEGSMTTLHANSPRDVITRLDSLVLLSDIELPVRAIREMVTSAIQLILHLARCSDGSRKILSVSELLPAADGHGVHLQDLFLFRQAGVSAAGTVEGRFAATGERPTFAEEFRLKGIALDEAVFASGPHAQQGAPP